MNDELIPYGANVSGGAFACADCGEGLQISSTQSLPPCPKHDESHTLNGWNTLYGRGEAGSDS